MEIEASVVGGIPPPNTFLWTMQNDDGSVTSLPAGEGGSTNVVSYHQAGNSSLCHSSQKSGVDNPL